MLLPLSSVLFCSVSCRWKGMYAEICFASQRQHLDQSTCTQSSPAWVGSRLGRYPLYSLLNLFSYCSLSLFLVSAAFCISLHSNTRKNLLDLFKGYQTSIWSYTSLICIHLWQLMPPKGTSVPNKCPMNSKVVNYLLATLPSFSCKTLTRKYKILLKYETELLHHKQNTFCAALFFLAYTAGLAHFLNFVWDLKS